MNITHGSILAVFFTASASERAEGRRWYLRANAVAHELATLMPDYKVTRDRCVSIAAGVIAALSPNNRWERNVIDAERLINAYVHGEECDAVRVCTFSKNKEKAIRILKGESPRDVLSGLKVRAFYGCIMDLDDVCVDGHAYSIWTGTRVPTSKTPSISPKLYDKIADDYRKATEQINVITGEQFSPAQVQAITWVTWRNLIADGVGQ